MQTFNRLQMLHRTFIKRTLLVHQLNCVYLKRHKSNVCVVGSGPAGFYTTELLLKDSEINVDIFEKLPIPFGLIRYGVAPDHPEIKNAINKFTSIATSERCSFYGNVNVGKDVSIKELLENYNAVVLAYGAAEDKQLGIPGEDCRNVFSARQFVGWYNGIPENANESINLDTDVAVIIGQGNVAVDAARIILRSTQELESTDITDHSFQTLKRSRIKKVVMLGRRGPLQVAFTVKEFRELTRLKGCTTLMSPDDFPGIKDILPTIQRPRHRLTELLVSTMEQSQKGIPTDAKISEIKFYRSPKLIVPDQNHNVQKIVLGINKQKGSPDSGEVISTGNEETIECGLIVRSVGYQSISIDPSLPFDKAASCIENKQGRINVKEPLYCSGWLKTGPIGVIPSTMRASYETGAKVLNDLKDGEISNDPKGGSQEILPLLKRRGIPVTMFDHWLKIDAIEQKRGSAIGKPREKINSIREMLQIAGI